jgi:hypothetical protein
VDLNRLRVGQIENRWGNPETGAERLDSIPYKFCASNSLVALVGYWVKILVVERL